MMLFHVHRRLFRVWLLLALLLAGGPRAAAAERVGDAPENRWSFPAVGLHFDADFPGARLNKCVRTDDGRFQLLVRAETTPINNSPWYAFRVRSDEPRSIELDLVYKGGTHRYVPKISRDGKSWTRLTGDAYQPAKDKPPRLRLDVGPEPLWVAAQELVTADDLYGWARRMADQAGALESMVGQSVGGRPLLAWRLGNADSVDHVVLIGRQHPPEVTGSLALMAFIDRLAADDHLADRFRQRFQITVVPLMNPDGVELGHWRCNLNLVDLNRDWMTFNQPEARAVRDEVQRLVAAGQSLRLLLDFHSTRHDVFYTLRDDKQTVPQDFTQRWLDTLQKQLPEYKVRREATYGSKSTLAAPWAFREFGAPAVTYEVGDTTDRTLIRTVARAASEAMMNVLLSDAAEGRLPSPTRP